MSSSSGPDEIQAVIFAAGKGSRMTQLLSGKPKCLLPIGNKPMIQYPLELLIRSGIKETLIIVLDTEEELIKSTVHKLGLDIDISYAVIPSAKDCATVDSLRLIKEKLIKDILILTSDLVTDIDLKSFIQLYRLENSTFQCLLSSIGSEKENLIPAKKLMDNKEFDIIGMDEREPNRLVFFEPDVMFAETVPFKKSYLEQCPAIKIQTNLQDAHVYLFKNWILDYLMYKENIHSLKADFVPSIVRKQFRKLTSKANESTTQDGEGHGDGEADHHHHHHRHFADFVKVPELYRLLDLLESGDLESDPPLKSYPESMVKCYAQVVDSGYCIRANNWVRFCEANRVVANKLKAAGVKPARTDEVKSFVDGVVGTGSTVGEKCVIKKTIIGANCKIGDKVKLTNCIILDNVTVEDSAALQGSVICPEVSIGNSAEINGCIVGPKQKIVALGRYTNESLTSFGPQTTDSTDEDEDDY